MPLVAGAKPIEPTSIQKKLAEHEASSGGRLGLSAINTANNMRAQYHAEELFPFCSTGKVIVISAILKESEKNPAILQKQISCSQKDVDRSGYAPITKQHIANSMNVIELCKAVIEYSDNTAMNLLMKTRACLQYVTTNCKQALITSLSSLNKSLRFHLYTSLCTHIYGCK